MATFVSASTNFSAGTTSFTVPLPAGLANGDVLIAAVNFNDAAEIVTPPADWSAIDGAPVEIVSAHEGGAWYHVYSGATTAPTWTISELQKVTGSIVAYRGVDTSAPIAALGARGTNNASTSLLAPAVTTTSDNQEIIGIFLNRVSNLTTVSTPSGMTSRASVFTSGGGATSASIFSQTIVTAGSSGSKTATYDLASSAGYAILIALKDVAVTLPPLTNKIMWGIPLVLNVASQVLGRFPGDPGVGNYYFGGREDQIGWPSSETAIANWESRMSPWSGGASLGIIRVFAAGDINTGFSHISLMNNHYANGRIPHVSFKLPGEITQAQAAAGTGSFATWMNNMAATMNDMAPKPVWWTFWHEPENDANFNTTTGAAEYRAICSNIKNGLRVRGVTNDMFWTTGYMAPYTFGDRGSTRDWRMFYPDWKGTTAAGSSKNSPNPVDFNLPGSQDAVVDGIGLDVYSWWGEGESTTSDGWTETFSDLFAWVHSRMGFLNLPYNIMEHGVEAFHTGIEADGNAVYDDARTLAYIDNMYDTMIAEDIVAMQVYNYRLTNDPWRLEVNDPNRARYQGYGLGMARPNNVLPSEQGWL